MANSKEIKNVFNSNKKISRIYRGDDNIVWQAGSTFAGETIGLDVALLPMNDAKHNTTIWTPEKITLSSGYHYYKFQDVSSNSLTNLSDIRFGGKLPVDIAVYDKDYNEVWSQLNVGFVWDKEWGEYRLPSSMGLTDWSKNWNQGHTLVLRSYEEISLVSFKYV